MSKGKNQHVVPNPDSVGMSKEQEIKKQLRIIPHNKKLLKKQKK